MRCLLVGPLIFFLLGNWSVEGYGRGKKTKCFSIPTLPKKVEQVIKSCQDEVKTNLIEDLLFAALNENPFEPSKHQHVLKEFEDHLFTHSDGSHSTHVHGPHMHHDDNHHLHAVHDPHHHHQSGGTIHTISDHASPHHILDPHYHHINPHQHHVSPHHLVEDHHSVDPRDHHHSSLHNVLSNLHIAPHNLPAGHHIIPQIVTKEQHHPISPLVVPHHHDAGLRHNPNPPIEHHPNPHPHDHHQSDLHLYQTNLKQPIVPLEVDHHLKSDPTTYHAVDVIEAHEALTDVFKTKRADPHDNHLHISAILDKLRNGPEDPSTLKWHRRSRRSLFGKWTTKAKEDEEYHPTVISHEDKWLAGCLMQCVYRKNNAVDKFGFPTLDGLTDLYTNGNNEQGFFIHVLKSVDKCLKAASAKYHLHKGKASLKGETCDVAFDVFDCVSDSITDYCSSV